MSSAQHLSRVVLIGLLSHALAFSSFFAILIGIVTDGTAYIPAYVLTALAMALFAFSQHRQPLDLFRRRLLTGGLVLTACGALSLFRIGGEHLLYPLIFFLPLSLLLISRLTLMVQDLAYLRQSLLEFYRMDMNILIVCALVTLLLQGDPLWQTKMIPFFLGFLATRLIALSQAARLLRGLQNKSKMSLFQGSLPFFLIGGTGLFAWMLHSLNVPVLTWIDKLLGPVFYGVGFIAQLFIEWLGGLDPDEAAETIGRAADRRRSLLDEEALRAEMGRNFLGENLLYIALVILAIVAVAVIYRQKKRMERFRQAEGIVEVREFIRRPKEKRIKPAAVNFPPLTPLRKTYLRFLLLMKKQGHARAPHLTALEHVADIAAARPDLQAEMSELTSYYLQERYGPHGAQEHLPRAQQITDDLHNKNTD